MANNFSRYLSKNIGTSASSVFTVPASTVSTLIGLTIANTSVSPITIDVYITSGGVDIYILKNADVAVGGAIVPIGGDQKIVMLAADILKVRASATSSVDAILSVLNIS